MVAVRLLGLAEKAVSYTVRLLLDFSADGSAKSLTDGDTPLHVAVDPASAVTTELLLHHGADPSARNRLGEQPLHLVSATYVSESSETVSVAQLLLDHGAELSALDSRGRTPLHRATCAGEADLA